jgi:hypothetical protein
MSVSDGRTAEAWAGVGGHAGGRISKGQGDAEGAAGSVSVVVGFDVAVMSLDERLGDRQAGSAVLAVAGRVGSIEAVEHPGQVFGVPSRICRPD